MKYNDDDLKLEQNIEFQKLKNERIKFKFEITKWIIIATGTIISFLVIDWGRLNLEKWESNF